MTDTITSTDAAASAPRPTRRGSTPRRLHVIAGLGGVAAFGFWVLQPILVFVVVGDRAELFGTWEYFQMFPWNGLYEGLVFGGIGLGLLTMMVAVSRLLDARARDASVLRGVGEALGVVAAVSWLVVAGLGFAPYTSVGYYLREFVPGVAEQKATYEALGLVSTGVLLVFALCMIGWLVALGTVGRRAGVIGWPLAIAAFVAAGATAAAFFVPFAPPWSTICGLVYALVLGVALLVKSRKA